MGFWTLARIHGITDRWARHVHKKYKRIADSFKQYFIFLWKIAKY